MSPFLTRTGYVAAALALFSAGLFALSIFGSSGHKSERIAAEPQADTRPSNTAFRYGPDVNHGRSDTPLNYTQQALREARGQTAMRERSPYQERTTYQARIGNPNIGLGLERPSGH